MREPAYRRIAIEREQERATLLTAVKDLGEALEEYLFAEEIDDAALRQAELAVCRQKARATLAKYRHLMEK